MSPALSRSLEVPRFEHGDASEVCDRIISDFYTGLPRISLVAMVNMVVGKHITLCLYTPPKDLCVNG